MRRFIGACAWLAACATAAVAQDDGTRKAVGENRKVAAQVSLAPALQAQLALDYPFDRATGYAEGQVYGIVAIKRPL